MGSRNQGRKDEAAYSAYVEWVKIPRQERIALNERMSAQGGYPTTKKEFAEKHDVNVATLWRWEQKPEFKKDVASEALGLLTADELTTILAELKLIAFDSNNSAKSRMDAMERLLKWSGIIGDFAVPLSESAAEEEEDDISNMSDEELEKLMLDNEWNDG